MSTKNVFKRIALVAAAALAVGGVTAVSAQAANIATPTVATQSLGAITRTSLNTWTEPVTITLTSSALAAGQTVTVVETPGVGGAGVSTAIPSVPAYTLLAGDVTSVTTATFTTTLTYTAAVATPVSETAALGTQTLTATIGGFVAPVSAAVTVPGNPNLQATVASTTTGSTATQVAGPANSVSISNFSPTNAVYFTVTGGLTAAGATAAAATGTVAASGVFSVATPTIGTITVTGYMMNVLTGTASTTSTDTVTITVTGALPGTSYSSATVLGASGVTTPTTVTDAAFSVVATGALPAVTVANFTVQELDASGLALTTGFKALAISSTLGTLTVGGAGLGSVTAAGGYAVGTPSGALTFALLNNGQSGVATVSVSVNGVAAKSYSVTFAGAATKIVLTLVNPVVAVGVPSTLLAAASSITANTNAIEVQEFDATGNSLPVNAAAITLTSSNALVATAAMPSVAVGLTASNFLGGKVTGTALSPVIGGVSVTGLTPGTTSFTASDSVGTLTSLPVVIRISSGIPTSVIFKTDSNSYASGGVGTLTTTLSDAAGTVPAGTYLALSYAGTTSSYALTSGTATLPTASITVNDAGIYTSTFNAPISDGTVVISATGATSTIVVTPATFTVASNASASVKEAIDAAKAATVAATAAGASADAATAAAKAAGVQAVAAVAAVAALNVLVVAALKNLKSLIALIARVVKKVKA